MKQDLLACSDCNVTVPCLLVDDSITSRDVECIRKKLIAHYLMYGPSALSSYSPNNSFANTGASAAINSSTQVGQSSTAQGGRVNEVYESKSNIIKDRVDVTTPQPSRTNHNTPTSAATTISSITNHETPASQLHDSVSYDHPVVCHYSYSPLSPEELEISDTITDNEFTFMDDEEGVYPLSSSTTPCSIRNISHSDESSFAIPVRSSSFGTRQNNYESEPVNEMHLDEQLESIHRRPSHSTKKHLQHFVQQERDEAYYLDYSPKVIDKDNFGTQRFMIANQLISNSGRRQLDGSHNFAHLQDHSTEDHRELSPNQSTDRSMSINELSGIKPPRSVSPQLSHRKSSPAFGSITPTNRIPSRHESPSSVSSSRDDSSVSNLISRESRHFRMVDSHLA